MRISQVVLIPMHSGMEPGNSHLNHNEYDIITGYLHPLIEHLEEDGVQNSVIDKDSTIYPNSLVIYCHGGWSSTKQPPKNNGSTIYYSNRECLNLAEHLREAVCDWGKCYVDLSHKMTSFIVDKDLCDVDGCAAISISPFALNGPKSNQYMQKLPMLAKVLSTCIFQYLVDNQWQTKIVGVKYD